ncbi:hypothetical protein ACE41F_26855 [Bacillus cereus]|uniref:hypothetical protein n=1 Tax=Bacillus cereus TaxID=1396 RepID=UPI0035C9ADA6
MQIEIKQEAKDVVQVGDIVEIKWTHMSEKWVGQITKFSANDNVYLHGLDGRSQFYRLRGYKTVAQLIDHMKASRSVQSCSFYSQTVHKLQVVTKGAK